MSVESLCNDERTELNRSGVDSPVEIYDWAQEVGGVEHDNTSDEHSVSSDRVMLLSSAAGSAVFAACEFGMALERPVATVAGVVTLYTSALLTARRLRSQQYEIL